MDITSFRRLAQHLQEDIGFRMLVANQTPDFLTLPDSWRHHLPAVGDLFVQVLELCQRTGLAQLGHAAVD